MRDKDQAMRCIPIYGLQSWWVLSLNARNILEHVGENMAKKVAESEYERFHRNRLETKARQADDEDFELFTKQIEDKRKAPES